MNKFKYASFIVVGLFVLVMCFFKTHTHKNVDRVTPSIEKEREFIYALANLNGYINNLRLSLKRAELKLNKPIKSSDLSLADLESMACKEKNVFCIFSPSENRLNPKLYKNLNDGVHDIKLRVQDIHADQGAIRPSLVLLLPYPKKEVCKSLSERGRVLEIPKINELSDQISNFPKSTGCLDAKDGLFAYWVVSAA